MGKISSELKRKLHEISGISKHDNREVKESIVREVINSVELISKQNKKPMNSAKLNKMLEHSELTEEDCLRLGNKVKAGMWKRYKKEGW